MMEEGAGLDHHQAKHPSHNDKIAYSKAGLVEKGT